MTKAVEKAPGNKLKRLADILGLKPKDIVLRTDKRLSFTEWGKILKGERHASTAAKRKVLAEAFGVTREHIDALLDGELEPEELAKVVQVSPPFVGLPFSAKTLPEHEGWGRTMAVFCEMAHVQKSRYPYLELCLLYHHENGKTWREDTVAAARNGHFGKDDMKPIQWEKALDTLDFAMRKHAQSYAK